MRIILFGIGRAGLIHAKNIMQMNGVELSAIVHDDDHIPSFIKNKPTIVSPEHYITLISTGNFDAAVISSPTEYHVEHVMNCLNHGIHVFVEKPLSNSIPEIKKCFDLARKQQLVLFVGYNRRYDNELFKIKNKLKKIDVRQFYTVSRDYPYPTSKFLSTCGGLFHDCATHDIDYVNWMLNKYPTSVYVKTNGVVTDDNYDFASILLNYDDKIHGTLILSRFSESYDQRCCFFGKKGELINNVYDNRSRCSFPERYHQAFKRELVQFYDAIVLKDYANNIPSELSCINNCLIANACKLSVERKMEIKINYQNDFRSYDDVAPSVIQNYRYARKYQTFAFNKKIRENFQNTGKYHQVWDLLQKLNDYVDLSDPDCTFPNFTHCIQTAERMRRNGEEKWLQVTGLIHDLGKIMFLRGDDDMGTGKNKQWATVGDTFVVGCKLPDSLIFSEFNAENPDMQDEVMKTECGVYGRNCGLDSVMCSFGHDEYLFQLLCENADLHSLPRESLYIIRYHSLYAHHQQNAYSHLTDEFDEKMLPLLKYFQSYDLYTKLDPIDNIQEEYYKDLILEFFPKGEIKI